MIKSEIGTFKAERSRIDLWSEPWWLENKYPSWTGLPKAELQRRIEVVQSVMNEDWLDWLANNNQTNAAVVAVGNGQGLAPLQQMLRVYDFIDTLSGSTGFEKKLHEYIYSDYTKGRSTRFELDIAYQLATQGASLEFPAERKDRVPDISGSYRGQSYSVECKFIQEQEWEKDTGDFMLRLAMSKLVADSNPKNLGFRIDLDPALSGLAMHRSKPKMFNNELFNEEIFSTLLSSIETRLCDELSKDEPLSEILEEGLYRILIFPTADDSRCGVSGGSASLVHIGREIIRRVVEACPQLYENANGYVAIHSHHPVTDQLLKFQFDALKRSNPELTRNLTGVLVVPQAYYGRTPDRLYAGDRENKTSRLFESQA